MQVLEYQTQPLSYQQPPIADQSAILSQNHPSGPVNDIINQTFNALNQTFEQIVDKVQSENSEGQNLYHHSFEDDWNFLYFIRLLFYVVVVLKLIELVFSKRRKPDIKDRVYRKYVFSHAEMIR